LHYLFAVVAASHAAERRALGSQVHAREAELRALRAQLNPHFLFNSLNSINALVGGDPEGARRMCERLGDFLRLTLRLGGRESVTLAEEMDLVERYLAIEQVRFGDRLRVEREIALEARPCLLPPLLLQPLVENAIKHGVADRVEGGIVRLEAVRREGRLRITLENPVDDDAPQRPGTGTGLVNVRRRLAVLSGRDAQISAGRDGGIFRVTLHLAARESAPEEDAHG
jgi:LytS/YehU family sensor histidine kinase